VWNHGDGWTTKNAKGISYDDETGNNITSVQLGQALAKIGGVNIYASDACLMQMAEVVYELKNSAPVIVGSEETEPGDGWNYAAFLSRLDSANLSTEAVAKAAVDGYLAAYAEKKTGVTMSAVRTAQAEPLRALTDQWAELAMKEDKETIKKAAKESLGFKGASSRDLLHFLSLAGEKAPALKAKGEEIAALVTDKMLIKNLGSGAPSLVPYAPVAGSAPSPTYADARGLAIYLPIYGFDDNYLKVAMSKDGKWDEFIKWLTAVKAE